GWMPALFAWPQRALDLGALAPGLRPGEGQRHEVAALLDGNEALKRGEDDAPLKLAVVGHAEVVPHHERHEDGAWRLHLHGDVAGDRDGDSGDAPSLYCALQERGRLMADGSGWRGEGDVGSLLRHRVGDLLRERALEALGVHVVAYEGEEGGC